ncbi:hypothetical protein [Tautonia plasticadhaerens]|uniref:Uncharacterized protein n=1 Tax=Tautonia plasticadhaerens TaxID=2527974 RepID=A0A518H717_9BACT|nr:hypothetical protein [Tautonia plasticadhaerens]QDV36556.1 hypothetical protein ElP_44840 [Tautonia plasticadhaerens]
MNVRMRIRIWMVLVLLVLVGLILSPFAADRREASRRKAEKDRWNLRIARAERIAREVLERKGWDVDWQAVDGYPGGADSCHVYIQSVGGGVERVIVPHVEDEPLIVLLHEIGPRSGDRSRVRIARDDLSIIGRHRAE